jgi:hypothetical protein
MYAAIDADDVTACQDSLPGLTLNPNMEIHPDPFSFGYTVAKCTSEYDGCQEFDAQSRSLLSYAAHRGAVKIVKHLLLNRARVGSAAAIGGIAGGCPEIVRLFDDQSQIFQSPLALEDLVPSPFEPPSTSVSFGGPTITAHVQEWIGFALSFCRTGIARWLIESKLPDPLLFCAAFWPARMLVPLSNNFEALMMFVDCGGDIPVILAPDAMRGVEKEAFLESGHATMLEFLSGIAAAAQSPDVFATPPECGGISQIIQRSHSASRAPFTESALGHVARSGSLRALECVWAASATGFDDKMICGAIVDAFQFGHADVAQWLLSRIDAVAVRSSIRGILLGGSARGAVAIADILVPYMTEVDDIRFIILAAAEAGNIELAKRWIGWQRERNPQLNLDEILLTGIRVGDLEIARLIGVRPDLIRSVMEVSIQAGFLEGATYALGLLPESGKAAVMAEYALKAANSPTPAVRSLFAGKEGEGEDADDGKDTLVDEGYDDYEYGC